LGAKLDRLVAKADEAGTEATVDYRRSIDHIKDKHAVVQTKLNAYKAANGQNGTISGVALRIAWHDLADAFKALKQ